MRACVRACESLASSSDVKGHVLYHHHVVVDFVSLGFCRGSFRSIGWTGCLHFRTSSFLC